MIIDSHVHWLVEEWIGEPFWKTWVWLSSRLSGVDPEKIKKRLPELWDPRGDQLIFEMTEAGIDLSLISPLDFGLMPHIGEARASIIEQNRAYALLANRNPKKLIALIGVDPRRQEASGLLEMGIKEWGTKGLKLHPATGFYPWDPVAYPLYEIAGKFDIPVLVHTGPAATPLYSHYCQPIQVDKVAADFSQVNFILAHMGYGWYSEAISLAANKPNIYLDIAGWQRELHSNAKDFYSVLRYALNKIGKERILFGSDWPFFKFLVSQKKWIGSVKDISRDGREMGFHFTENEIQAICGENAKKLFKIE